MNETDVVQAATAIARLREHHIEWVRLPPSERAKWLWRLQDWIFANTQAIADVIQSETAKPRMDALMEIAFVAEVLAYYARHAARFLAPERVSPHGPAGMLKRQSLTYHPYPVVGVITPWNYPFGLPGVDVVPALLAGAAVALKPSEVTPRSAGELARGWAEIGAPLVFEMINGGRATGAAVVDAVDFVQFTGSTRTGKAIGNACVERMVPFGLELGGKDPALVLADADIDRAARGIAFGGLLNAGQMCTSIERVYVEAPVYEEFVARLTERVRELRQGRDHREFRYDIGALVTQPQLDIVRRHIEQAVASGARVAAGGNPGEGTFFEPTVLIDVDHTMDCVVDESFGPILPVMRVADADEAVRLANDSPYGLSATVWTRDRERGARIARRLEAGAVNINDAHINMLNLTLPMGGWKQSGLGARFGGAHGIRKYCRVQAVTADRLGSVPSPMELVWFPYSAMRAKLLMSGIRVLDRGDVRSRIERFDLGRRYR